jgi:polar amino acid transport system substrate-binding protein
LPGGGGKQPLLTLCHDALPPYAIGNGEWITDGIKFRLMRDVLNEAGVRMRVLQLPWARCQIEAAAGRVDGILPTFKTPERDSKFVFSEPVLNQESAFFFLRKQFSSGLEWSSYDDLRGNRLGMILGSVIDPAMEKTLASGGMLVRGNDAETLMKLLQHQRLDLVALDRQVGLYEMGTLGLDNDIRVSTQLINRRPAMLALSRKSKQASLMPRINQAIERMSAAGRLSL